MTYQLFFVVTMNQINKKNMNPDNIPFKAFVVGPTNSAKTR